MKAKVKKIAFYLIKLIVSAALVWLAVRRIEPDNLFQYIRSLPLYLFVMILLGGVVNLGLQFIRFRLIIDECRHEISTPRLLKVFFIGFAFRLTVPGGHGEAAKMLFIPGETKNRITAYGIEKLSISVLITFLFGPSVAYLFPEHPAFLFISLVPVAGILMLFFLKNKPVIQKWTITGTRYRLIALKTILLTAGIYGVFITQYWLLLQLYNIEWLTVAAICILVMGAASLPISVSGLGIRENTTAWLLAGYGVAPAVGVGVPLMVFVMNVVFPAVIGGVLLLTINRQTKP